MKYTHPLTMFRTPAGCHLPLRLQLRRVAKSKIVKFELLNFYRPKRICGCSKKYPEEVSRQTFRLKFFDKIASAFQPLQFGAQTTNRVVDRRLDPIDLTQPLEHAETEQHQRQSSGETNPGPFATGDTKASGGDDVRDVARYQHSAADQESHQHAALLGRR